MKTIDIRLYDNISNTVLYSYEHSKPHHKEDKSVSKTIEFFSKTYYKAT